MLQICGFTPDFLVEKDAEVAAAPVAPNLLFFGVIPFEIVEKLERECDPSSKERLAEFI